MAEESWKKIDLAPSQAYVLTLVINEPVSRPGDCGTDAPYASTITRLIQKLEEKKLLTRISEGKQACISNGKIKSLYRK